MNDRPEEAAPVTGVSRRTFIQTLGVSAAASAVQARQGEASPAEDAPPISGPGTRPVTLRVNGRGLRCQLEPATTLLDALRHDLRMTGTKEICDRGSCGGCSVLVDGVLVASCMMLAHDAIGSEITTVEGLAGDGATDAIQEAFIRHDALQCGYCTPGILMASRALLDSNPRPTLDEIREGLAGNICRCGTYTNVFNALLDASGQEPLHDPEGE